MWAFRVNAQLIAPTLTFPADTARITNHSAFLQWQPSTDATTYRLQLASDANFTDLVVDLQVTDAHCQVNITLQNRATYHWRVMAIDGDVISDWSAHRSFTMG